MPDREQVRASAILRRQVVQVLPFAFGLGPAFALDAGGADEASAGAAAALALIVGVFAFATAAAGLALRERARAAAALREAVGLRTALERVEAILDAEPGVRIAFEAPDEPPRVFGDAAFARSLSGGGRRSVLVFGSWAEPGAAAELERRVDALRARGQPFLVVARARDGRPIEARGRIAAGRAVVALGDLGDERSGRARLAEDAVSFRRLLESVPFPVWRRDAPGRLAWVNPAFAQAAGAATAEEAAARGMELFDQAARRRAAAGRATAVATAAGRRLYEVVETPLESGSAGIALDVTAREEARAELKRHLAGQARTLDQLTTAVAIFGADRRLRFCNAAWRDLFALDPAWLATAPEDGAVLDRLRSAGRLPEQADYRTWKRAFLEAGPGRGPVEHWWHLPDGRTLRVVVAPAPQGGAVHVYEDHTERFHLESRYNALIRMQRETLDALREGVAVFGSDGRLRLSNPAFAEIWGLEGRIPADRPHVDEIAAWCQASCLNGGWERIKAVATALSDERFSANGRIERTDGRVTDYVVEPLPAGATLVTFADVTAGVAVQRALQERNEALEAADRLKTLFVRHVSYELRTPLTTIIGFAELLADRGTGTLNERQRDYAEHIQASSAALLAIIDGILDLATIDAGAMELELEEVGILAAMEAAADGVRDRLAEEGVVLDIEADPAIGSFRADGKRVRQILFNLLSNAIRFSDRGGRVRLAARREAGGVRFTVSDRGRGIAPDHLAHVFDRFEAWPAGNKRSGAGLGLALVKSFVELHGGTVSIRSKLDQGTTVTCFFPEERGARETSPPGERVGESGTLLRAEGA